MARLDGLLAAICLATSGCLSSIPAVQHADRKPVRHIEEHFTSKYMVRITDGKLYVNGEYQADVPKGSKVKAYEIKDGLVVLINKGVDTYSVSHEK